MGDREELDVLDAVEMLESLNDLLLVCFRHRCTQVHDDDTALSVLAVLLDQLAAKHESLLGSHRGDGELEGAREGESVKEHVGLDAQLREAEDKTLTRRSGGTLRLSLLVGSLGSLNRFGGLSSEGCTSVGGSGVAGSGGVVSHVADRVGCRVVTQTHLR